MLGEQKGIWLTFSASGRIRRGEYGWMRLCFRYRVQLNLKKGDMVKLVYTLALGARAERRESSSLSIPTI